MRKAVAIAVSTACLALAPTAPVLAAIQRPAFDWQAYLRAKHQKVARDSEELVKLTAELCKATRTEPKPALSADLQERILDLEEQSQKLQDAVQSMDENVLSVEVVNLSHQIREEAKALKKRFGKALTKRQRNELGRLARQIEKRADSVYDRTRSP